MWISIFLLGLFSQIVLAIPEAEPEEEIEEQVDSGTLPDYHRSGRTDITYKAKAQNFGAVYGAQWAFYLLTQDETIENDGSFENWYKNPFKPGFDRDTFDYNLIKHSLVGNYYYLFYRSRGYTVKDAFFWSFMSSLAFEFTIETITEVPSYQDIYQTPVFGVLLGIGFEKTSEYFHSWDNWYGNFLGYLLNPMTLIPQFADDSHAASLTPMIDQKTVGAVASFRF